MRSTTARRTPTRDLVSVVGTVREAFGAKVAEEVASVVHDAGKFTEVKSVDEDREQLISTYALFGEHRNRVLEYVGCFRTKRQIETGAKMDPVRHLRILEELLSIYQTGLFPYDGKQYVVTQEQLMSVIDNVANREMVHLKNHNYLKMVLKNQPSKKNETEDTE